MGWNGYNAFGCAPELDEAKVRATIEVLVASGMQSAGYQYVNLDDCWQLTRTAEGVRQFDPVRLPGGIETLSNDVHDLGLSLGVWAPLQDCRGEPGSEGYETVDAETYAAWGVDYVKYVDCFSELTESSVSVLADALANTGRPTVLSLATPPFREWMRDTARLWRTGGIVEPTWSSLVGQIDAAVPLAAYARPGAFNDPDMLEIGNGALTPGEIAVHFSVWSILSAPLIAGNDLTTMTDETLDILTNSRLIGVNQDPLGLQAALIRREGDVEILAKPLAECGARAVVLWNRSETSAEVSVGWEELWLERGPATVHDLWSDETVASGSDDFSVVVAGHDAVALRVTGVESPLPRGRVYLSDLRWTTQRTASVPSSSIGPTGRTRRSTAHRFGSAVQPTTRASAFMALRCFAIASVGPARDSQPSWASMTTRQAAAPPSSKCGPTAERLFQSGVLTGASPARELLIDVRDKRELRLFVGVGGDTNGKDHAVWAGARLECDPGGAAPE